jgi:hypothetical protein
VRPAALHGLLLVAVLPGLPTGRARAELPMALTFEAGPGNVDGGLKSKSSRGAGVTATIALPVPFQIALRAHAMFSAGEVPIASYLLTLGVALH